MARSLTEKSQKLDRQAQELEARIARMEQERRDMIAMRRQIQKEKEEVASRRRESQKRVLGEIVFANFDAFGGRDEIWAILDRIVKHPGQRRLLDLAVAGGEAEAEAAEAAVVAALPPVAAEPDDDIEDEGEGA